LQLRQYEYAARCDCDIVWGVSVKKKKQAPLLHSDKKKLSMDIHAQSPVAIYHIYIYMAHDNDMTHGLGLSPSFVEEKEKHNNKK
jgi:hypothetical protein